MGVSLLYKSYDGILRGGNTLYYCKYRFIYIQRGGKSLNSEIKELNRIICKQCDEKDYEKCKSCRIYQLINKIATS
ncbi:MAG: hypothetical protein ACUVUF_00810 [Candidatus Bathycorpusculaceae bacterium]